MLEKLGLSCKQRVFQLSALLKRKLEYLKSNFGLTSKAILISLSSLQNAIQCMPFHRASRASFSGLSNPDRLTALSVLVLSGYGSKFEIVSPTTLANRWIRDPPRAVRGIRDQGTKIGAPNENNNGSPIYAPDSVKLTHNVTEKCY